MDQSPLPAHDGDHGFAAQLLAQCGDHLVAPGTGACLGEHRHGGPSALRAGDDQDLALVDPGGGGRLGVEVFDVHAASPQLQAVTHAAEHVQLATMEEPTVSGPQVAVDEPSRVARPPAVVAAGHRGAGHHDLPEVPVGERAAVMAGDPDADVTPVGGPAVADQPAGAGWYGRVSEPGHLRDGYRLAELQSARTAAG